jgi:hypothetical protein
VESTSCGQRASAMTRRKSKFGERRVRQLEARRAARVGPCRFPLWARLKRSSPSDGIQPPFVSCQELSRPVQGFKVPATKLMRTRVEFLKLHRDV